MPSGSIPALIPFYDAGYDVADYYRVAPQIRNQ